MQKKLVMLFVAIILAFVVLIGRITYINVFKGGKYTRIVLNQQQYGSRTIPYKRGDIVDRNGTKVATSERVYNVILDVVVVTDEGESDKYIDSTLDVLEECFDGVSAAAMPRLRAAEGPAFAWPMRSMATPFVSIAPCRQSSRVAFSISTDAWSSDPSFTMIIRSGRTVWGQ